MIPQPGHRKRIKHDDAPGEAHELTFSCYCRMQLLRLESRCKLLAESIDRAIDRHDYQLLAYVFMPEHVHLLVLPGPSATGISKLLYGIKKPFSFRVKQQLTETEDPLLATLTIRDRPGRTSFRFWQEGPGYDRNVRQSSTMWSMIDYIHSNPIRRGLVKNPADWKWSSWHVYEGENGQAPMQPKVTPWS